MIEAAKNNRHGHRDASMILVAYRHGLRAAEVCSLEWSQVDFALATLHVRRVMYGRCPRCKRNLTISEAFGCGHVFGLLSLGGLPLSRCSRYGRWP